MKSKRTAKELLEWMKGEWGTWEEADAEEFAAFLGVELAPEPEPLADFWGEGLKVDEEGLVRAGWERVEFHPLNDEGRRNRRALALSHSLRVAAAELVERETREDGYLKRAYASPHLIRRLRKILLGNELPEGGGER